MSMCLRHTTALIVLHRSGYRVSSMVHTSSIFALLAQLVVASLLVLDNAALFETIGFLFFNTIDHTSDASLSIVTLFEATLGLQGTMDADARVVRLLGSPSRRLRVAIDSISIILARATVGACEKLATTALQNFEGE